MNNTKINNDYEQYIKQGYGTNLWIERKNNKCFKVLQNNGINFMGQIFGGTNKTMILGKFKTMELAKEFIDNKMEELRLIDENNEALDIPFTEVRFPDEDKE